MDSVRGIGMVFFLVVLVAVLAQPAPVTPEISSLPAMNAEMDALLGDHLDAAEQGILALVTAMTSQAAGDGATQAPTVEPGIETPTDVSNPDDMTLRRPQSLTPLEIDGILLSYLSPASNTGQTWYDLGVKWNIDAAYPLAFFVIESRAGTAQGWAGFKGSYQSTTHNIGNIICAGYPTCYGRFRDYPDWETGIEDWYRLINDEYINGRGHVTVDDVIPVYAPAFENDVDGYRSGVAKLVAGWRRAKLAGW